MFAKRTMALFCGVGMAVMAGAAQAEDKWPERPVTMIVVAGAGGGSDYTFRLLARGLEEATDGTFSVVNQAQGGGIVGYTTYTTASPDGYTLGQLSPFAQFKPLGQADFTAKSFTPIAMINADPAAIHVAANAELTSLGDVIDKLKQDPSSLKISCGGTCNASWDIPFVSLLLAEGVDVAKLNLIPASGSAAALQEMAAGGIDVVLCSIPETDALTQAGLVKTVAVMSEERLEKYPDVATARELTGKDVTGGTWRGLAGPAGMDPDLVKTIEADAKKAYDSFGYQAGMSDRGFGAVWLGSEEFAAFLDKHVDQTNEVLEALGQTQ